MFFGFTPTVPREGHMSLLEEFGNRYTEKPTEPAKVILFGIIDDLTGRSGFGNEWDAIDPDIKEELLETNLKIVTENLPQN